MPDLKQGSYFTSCVCRELGLAEDQIQDKLIEKIAAQSRSCKRIRQRVRTQPPEMILKEAAFFESQIPPLVFLSYYCSMIIDENK